MILVSDPVGGTAEEPGAHGSAFDRVGAFQDGFTNGALVCVPYLDNPPPSTLFAFDMNDPTGGTGNAPYEELLPLILESLNQVWPTLLEENGIAFTAPELLPYPNEGPYPPCGDMQAEAYPENFFYCADTNQVMFDEGYAGGLYEGIGDFAIGYLVGSAYADAVQHAIGSTLSGAQRALFNDCLTGVWTAGLTPMTTTEESVAEISPGDLDEAVRAALVAGDPDADTDRNGVAFDKIAAFRTGFISGLTACNDTYG
jgi:predicted metalloprotease